MSNMPPEDAKLTETPAEGQSWFFSWRGVVLFFIAALLLIALFLPATRLGTVEGVRRMNCQSNLKQISIGMHNYESVFGTLPPAFTVDAEGNRLHSWRTVLLRYMNFMTIEVYEKIDLSKPWDDPANAEARAMVVEEYLCPSAKDEEGLTTFLGIVGPDCVFSGEVPRALDEIADGLGNTIGVIDAPSDRAVHWMSPHDISEDEVLQIDSDSKVNHPGIVNAMFLDWSVKALYLDMDPAELSGMMTIAGGEKTAE